MTTRGGACADVPAAGEAAVAAPAAVSAAAALRRRIAAAELTPGMRLREVALASELEVSRNSLREAFAALAGEGLVERVPHRGVFVAAPGPDDVRRLYRTRRVIQLGALREGQLTEEADAHFARAQELLGDDGAQRPPKSLGDANHLLHVGMVGLADSPELSRVMASVLARVRLAFHPMDAQTELHELFADRNRWTLARLRAGELAAVEEMLPEYLAEAETFVLDHLEDHTRR